MGYESSLLITRKTIPATVANRLDHEIIANALEVDPMNDINKLFLSNYDKDIVSMLYEQLDITPAEVDLAIAGLYLMNCKINESWSDNTIIKIFKYAYILYRHNSKLNNVELYDTRTENEYILPNFYYLMYAITGHEDVTTDRSIIVTEWFAISLKPLLVLYIFNVIDQLLSMHVYNPLEFIEKLYGRMLNANLAVLDTLLVALSCNDAYTRLALSTYGSEPNVVANELGLVVPKDVNVIRYIDESIDMLEYLNDSDSTLPSNSINAIIKPIGIVPPAFRLKPKTHFTILTGYMNNVSEFGLFLFPYHRFTYMSDRQIINEANVLLPYISRLELVRLYESYEQGNKHIFKIIDNTPYVGQHSPISFDDITMNSELYGVGNIERKVYLLHDIFDAVHEDEHNIVRISLDPLPSRPSIENAIELRTIAEQYERYDIADLIDIFIEQSEDPLSNDKTIIPDRIALDFKEFLTNLVYIGLYARRWKGPTKPIPYTNASTNVKSNMHEQRIHKLMIKNNKLMTKSLQDVMEFIKPYNFSNNIANGHFPTIYTMFRDGERCIRETAECFIATGFHYIKAIYGEVLHINGEPIDLTRFEFMNPIAPEEYPISQ